MTEKETTWIEINPRAFKKNIRSLRDLAGSRLVAAAVKANAYGHGLKEIIGLLVESDIEYIAVHSSDEAVRARQYGWERKILCVGYITRKDSEIVFDCNVEPTVYNIETIKTLGRLSTKHKKPVSLHLKIETGTNRQGLSPDKLSAILEVIKKHPYLKLHGVSTHFANIEDTTDHSYAESQLRKFNDAVKTIKSRGFRPKLRHTASSAALILFDKTRFELVRPGIALYGLWPSKETYLSYRLRGGDNGILEPILTWKTKIAQIKNLEADEYIGYGCTYRTTSRTKLAVLPIGYYDGYSRSLSNLAYVIIRGRRAPVRGRVCMNLIMVDITDIPGVKLEDEVILLGADSESGENVTADQMALWAGTVNYEIIGRLGEHIPKIVVDS